MAQMINCQSCGMPLRDDGDYGSNKDGSQSLDYCIYCYDMGEFTQDVTMDQMVDICVPHMHDYSHDEAEVMLRELLPKLKRWK